MEKSYNKEGSFNMIFTSNKNPVLWRETFEEDVTLLCTLDRIFDDATVFKLHGESFRGKMSGNPVFIVIGRGLLAYAFIMSGHLLRALFLSEKTKGILWMTLSLAVTAGLRFLA